MQKNDKNHSHLCSASYLVCCGHYIFEPALKNIKPRKMSLVAVHKTQQHQLEVELWLKELSFLNDEIEIMKHHLPDVYYRDNPEDITELVCHFDETFSMHQQWLRRMRSELEKWDPEDEWNILQGSFPGRKTFCLQMQANRIISQELKDSFIKLFS